MRRSERDAAFTAFVETRRRGLVQTAYLLCGDRDRAEDLTQQALVRLYRAWPRVGSRGGEDAYVRRALVSAQIDDWRWRSRRPETPVAQHFDSQLDGQLGPFDRPDGRGHAAAPSVEDHEVLRTALQRLPEAQRKVVVLRYWLDLSVAQTASDLGISHGTVKSQSARALAHLRTALAPDFPTLSTRSTHD